MTDDRVLKFKFMDRVKIVNDDFYVPEVYGDVVGYHVFDNLVSYSVRITEELSEREIITVLFPESNLEPYQEAL